MKTSLKKSDVEVATDLYYVNVTKKLELEARS